MRLLFTMPDCPFCSIAKSAILFINLHLPMGDQIETINIFSTDPRNSYMAAVFGNETREGWAVPLLIVDKPRIVKTFKTYMESRGRRIMLRSVETPDVYYYLALGVNT